MFYNKMCYLQYFSNIYVHSIACIANQPRIFPQVLHTIFPQRIFPKVLHTVTPPPQPPNHASFLKCITVPHHLHTPSSSSSSTPTMSASSSVSLSLRCWVTRLWSYCSWNSLSEPTFSLINCTMSLLWDPSSTQPLHQDGESTAPYTCNENEIR